MLLRLLACIGLVTSVSACSRLREARLIGTWRYEDDDGVEEITLRRDHSFLSLETFKKEFVIPSPIERTGSWQLTGNELLLDSTVTWSKERSQLKRTVERISSAEFVEKSSDGKQSFVYMRLEEVACAASSTQMSHLTEAALIGSWQTHYNTHDYQYRFGPNNRIGLFAFISNEWKLLHDGEWHIKDGRLFMQFQKDAAEPEDIWTPVAIRADCIAMKSGSSRPCIMRRIQ